MAQLPESRAAPGEQTAVQVEFLGRATPEVEGVSPVLGDPRNIPGKAKGKMHFGKGFVVVSCFRSRSQGGLRVQGVGPRQGLGGHPTRVHSVITCFGRFGHAEFSTTHVQVSMPVYRAIGVSMDYPRAADGDPTAHAGTSNRTFLAALSNLVVILKGLGTSFVGSKYNIGLVRLRVI